MYKTVKRPDWRKNILDRIYLFAILKGMLITFSHIFKKRVTMQYPEEKWEVKPGYRGSPVLMWDKEKNREKCVACMLCMFVCPPEAICIEPEETEATDPLEKHPKIFNIDMTRCIYCGFCEEACPKEAIVLSDEYELTGWSRKSLQRDKERLLELGEAYRARAL